MPELKVVPFDDKEGRLAGDSSWSPNICFDYVEGMTLDDVIDKAAITLMSVYDETDCDSLDDFKEEYCFNCTGGWVIKKDTLDIINSLDIELGGDSITYAVNAAMKSQVAHNAEFVIE